MVVWKLGFKLLQLEGQVEIKKPVDLRVRHLAIMDALMTNPRRTQKDIAAALGYSADRLSSIVNQPLFKMAFAEYRRKFEEGLREKVTSATLKAVQLSEEIAEDKSEPTPVRQESIKELLALGHAKAIERKATLAIGAELPKGAFEALAGLMKELEKPFEPTKRLEKAHEVDVEAQEIFEAEQIISQG